MRSYFTTGDISAGHQAQAQLQLQLQTLEITLVQAKLGPICQQEAKWNGTFLGHFDCMNTLSWDQRDLFDKE